jgi:hypothetical protein
MSVILLSHAMLYRDGPMRCHGYGFTESGRPFLGPLGHCLPAVLTDGDGEGENFHITQFGPFSHSIIL